VPWSIGRCPNGGDLDEDQSFAIGPPSGTPLARAPPSWMDGFCDASVAPLAGQLKSDVIRKSIQ